MEDFLWQSGDALDRLEDLREEVSRGELGNDVATARQRMDQHNEMKKQVTRNSVDEIDLLGQRLLQR